MTLAERKKFSREAPRGISQSAYRILVSSSQDLLNADKGDIWDSGKAGSAQSIQIEYGGKPLFSRMVCYWKVKSWFIRHRNAMQESESSWSRPTSWEMGLLEPSNWTAKWIEKGDGIAADRTLTLPASLSITKATFGVDGAQADVTAKVGDLVTKNKTLLVQADLGLSGKDPAPGKRKKLVVEYELDGKHLSATVDEGGLLAIPQGFGPNGNLSYLRKTFTAPQTIVRARLYVTAQGLYVIHINGQRVGDHVFAPEWTNPIRLRYQVYDVTGLLRMGKNALAAVTANGWYMRANPVDKSALFTQLEILYQDGSTERVGSDASWTCHASPILSSDFLMGENYDARAQVPGWDMPGKDDGKWHPVKVRDPGHPLLDGQVMEPSRKLDEMAAKKLTEPKPGCWVFDLGQNMVGFVRLKVSAKAGDLVTLRHAEVLNPDGTLYTANLRSAKSTDSYRCRGGGVEIWEPQFTFHGFRYVEVTGLASKPPMDLVTGIVIGSDTPPAGSFACSDARVNQLYSNIRWGQRGNYLSVPTDCPQRDERLGWMGDAQVFVKTAALNNNVAAFFTKWMVDVDDGQAANGSFSDISPGGGGGASPGWGDAGVICPWTMYLAYGDKRMLEKHLPAMTRWVEWYRANSRDLVQDRVPEPGYGDWLAIGADTPKVMIATAYSAYSTRIVAKAYQAIGKEEEAAKYEQLFQDIRTAFNKAYVGPDGRIKGNTQCSYVMAISFDLLSEELKAKAAMYLVDDIQAKGWHLSTGFVGVSYLLPSLTNIGRTDIAYRLLLQDTFPSWLFSVKQGATTIWERWDGWTPEKGFQDPGMNSFNHYSYGSCGEWLFNSMAGIAFDPNMPGYKHIICRPHPGAGITWIDASYDSIYGLIGSSWKTENDMFSWKVTIPANTTATLFVPAMNQADITESGRAASGSEGLMFLRMDHGAAVFEAQSGQYDIKAKPYDE